LPVYDLVQPGVVAEFARRRDGVEDPQPLAGPHVEAAHVALDVTPACRHAARPAGGADDDDVLDDDRRSVEADLARVRIDDLVVVLFQIDQPVGAES
jgi:hypothetical protein